MDETLAACAYPLPLAPIAPPYVFEKGSVFVSAPFPSTGYELIYGWFCNYSFKNWKNQICSRAKRSWDWILTWKRCY